MLHGVTVERQQRPPDQAAVSPCEDDLLGGPETRRLVAELIAAGAREKRLREMSLTAAFTAADDLDTCHALLAGTLVPGHRLDPAVAEALRLDPAGGLVLDLDTVERILLLQPVPRIHLCSKCGHVEAA